jgi:tRNA threonylcarbamoyl adenosine modification protein YeaZ
MRIISFDTSASDLHVALNDNDNIEAEVVVTAKPGSRQYAASELIPTIEKMLEECRCSKENIDAIAVGTGPGSFTGIRVAVVTARTLAQALEIPLVGVSLFDCYAIQTELPSTYLLDAGRGHVYIGAYDQTAKTEPCHIGQSFKLLIEPFSTTLGELKGQLPETSHLYAENSLLNELKNHAVEAKLLPPLNNIAAMQSKIAFHRVSLKESQLEKNFTASDLRKTLRNEFHYELVRPLYLRQASITLKGAVQ